MTSSGQRLPARAALPYSPYADAWKEFERLDKFLHTDIFRYLQFLFWLVSSAGTVGFTIAKHYRWYISAAWAMLLVAEFAWYAWIKNRFKHWKCPQCRAEWPGSDKKKDPACKVCGLRLYQLTA